MCKSGDPAKIRWSPLDLRCIETLAYVALQHVAAVIIDIRCRRKDLWIFERPLTILQNLFLHA